ncbi:MAG: hypothetical protein J6N19_15895 [Clostridium sp.]|nr:hypothetical protein [Clostridium sp.]
MNTVLTILSIIIIIATLSFIVFVVFDWNGWAGVISLTVILICSIAAYNIKRQNSTEKAKPIVVYTKQPPQIDTVVTIINGVADTTYIYHLMKEDK